ncbi:MAG: 50S ribosomal protein L6 [Planctomycetota bacterium]|jgi:large subunit ribosomal protein L6
MSRIGKKTIEIPSGVKVEQKGREIKVTGPLGNLNMDCHRLIEVKVEGNKISVANGRPGSRQANELHGTMRSLIANMVDGVSKGFAKKMEIYGTGYGIKEQAGALILQVGFCHSVRMAVPKNVKVSIETPVTRGNDVPARFTLTSIDKCVLGQFAAEIRKVRPPEPYKGKGIRYAGEHVRRKIGKAFATGPA